jgi:hypothetical protein
MRERARRQAGVRGPRESPSTARERRPRTGRERVGERRQRGDRRTHDSIGTRDRGEIGGDRKRVRQRNPGQIAAHARGGDRGRLAHRAPTA